MSNKVPADQIEAIVGMTRLTHHHVARANSAERVVYVLHSQSCLDQYDDVRECKYSLALDRGIDNAKWAGHEDQPVLVAIVSGRLEPM